MHLEIGQRRDVDNRVDSLWLKRIILVVLRIHIFNNSDLLELFINLNNNNRFIFGENDVLILLVSRKMIVL